jgi:CopG family nickel-responsive transcriptional regulator
MEETLLSELDALVAARGGTRSEVLRDLVRAEVVRSHSAQRVPAVATLTLVYDHHVRDLSERLTEMQHDLGEQVRSTLHIHLDHDNCLEVIVMRGMADELQAVADRLIATKGVKHGGLELFTEPDRRVAERTPRR